MNRIHAFFLFLVGLATAIAAPFAVADTVRVANTDLEILGIGNAQELRTDVFMGALYAPAAITSIEAAREDSVPKRMTMKILQDNWSNREMVRKTKERIALNNPRALWQAQGQYILDFASIFQESLRRGDRIDLDNIPGEGVKVYVNGQLARTLKSNAFFNLMLSSWVGDNPASQSFKSGISGALSSSEKASLVASYDALLPLPNRSYAVAKVEPKPEPKPEQKPEPKAAAKPEVAKAETKPAPAKPTPAKAEEAKPEAETLVAATKIEQKPVETKATEPKVTEVKKAEPKPVAPLVLELPETLVEQAFVDPDLLVGDYKREVMPLFRQNVKYPAKAYKDQLQGEGVVRVTVDKRGNLLGTEIVESTGERILDRALSEMVSKTMPLPAMPNELPDEPYNIDIPVKFSL